MKAINPILRNYENELKIILFVIFSAFAFNSNATPFEAVDNCYNHLIEVNKEWINYKNVSPKKQISFQSDRDRIQLHLNLAIEHLQTNIPKQFNVEQVKHRLNLLAQLQDYADQKVFPINLYHSKRTPYFVDHLGTNCAVGQMIYVSGHKALVKKISASHNYDYIKDITTEGLTEWANEYGFTVDELKWIQPGYPPAQTIDQIEGGTNGEVKQMEYSGYNNYTVIVGDFTELDGFPCLGIGTYKDEQLSCIGNGIEGTINDVLPYGNNIIVAGEFPHNGQMYPIALWDGHWNYISIPSRSEAVGNVLHYSTSNYFYEVTIDHDSLQGQQELWGFHSDSIWKKRLRINGFINDISSSPVGNMYVGHFDAVLKHNNFNSNIDTIDAQNVIVDNFGDYDWYRIGSEISDTVNVVKQIGQTMYFGGTCSGSSGGNDICISRYFNSTLQPIFTHEYGTQDYSINAIAYHPNYGSKFIFGGDFYNDFGWTYGDNLASYNLVNNIVTAMAILDGPVNSIQFNSEEELVIGGDFNYDQSTPINYLGKFSSTVGTNEFNEETDIKVYPNPFIDEIKIEGLNATAQYEIVDLKGQVLAKGEIIDSKISDLERLPKGTYFVNILSGESKITKKLIK